MAPFLRANFSDAVLAEEISQTSKILSVQEGHNLPSTIGSFQLTIFDPSYGTPSRDPNVEIVTASYAGRPNIYHIIRAQELTSSRNHLAGDKAVLLYTAGTSRDDLTWLGGHQVVDFGAVDGSILSLLEGKLRYTRSPFLQDLTLTEPKAVYSLHHDRFAGFSPSKHVDHNSVTIKGADGCSGGGSIAGNQTITNTDKGSVARAAHEQAYDHKGFISVETDPVFCLSSASGIREDDITNWDTAFGWGDHSGRYDPVGSAAATPILRSGGDVDRNVDSFVCSGGWTRLDLKSVLPKGTTKFWCRVVVQSSGGVGKRFGLRRTKSSAESDSHYVATQVSGVPLFADLGPVGVDFSCSCEYFVDRPEDFQWDRIDLIITAYR